MHLSRLAGMRERRGFCVHTNRPSVNLLVGAILMRLVLNLTKTTFSLMFSNYCSHVRLLAPGITRGVKVACLDN